MGVAEGREVFGDVAAFHATMILGVNRVAVPIEAVFDALVNAPGVEQSCGDRTRAGDAGDGELEFPRRLGRPRELFACALCSYCKGISLAPCTALASGKPQMAVCGRDCRPCRRSFVV